MFTPCSWLPSEVWTHVFGYLPPPDRLRVRAVCKDFRDVVEARGLLRDLTVTLKSAKGAYNKQFWRSLRRWRVSSAVLSASRSWAHIATELPHLTTLIVDSDRNTALDSLQCFTNLERLYLRGTTSMPLDQLFPLLHPQLVHLSVCAAFMKAERFDSAAHLTNLTSLVCHCSFGVEPEAVLPTILSALPQLTHLSLLSPSGHGRPVNGKFCPVASPVRHHSLTSLELINHFFSLPLDLMKMVPSLRSLALCQDNFSEHSPICSWLRDLPALTCLLVVGGPRVKVFARFIPSSVTHLTLRPMSINLAEMSALSEQLPNLLHLHLEPCRFLGADTALLPRFFPGLRSLRLRHERVPEMFFLRLASLMDLELLETQDPVPARATLISKLLELTKNRVRISQRPGQDPMRTCSCASHLPSENWDKVRV